jgi:hypothetical protein
LVKIITINKANLLSMRRKRKRMAAFTSKLEEKTLRLRKPGDNPTLISSKRMH